jgi:hypothetical protein
MVGRWPALRQCGSSRSTRPVFRFGFGLHILRMNGTQASLSSGHGSLVPADGRASSTGSWNRHSRLVSHSWYGIVRHVCEVTDMVGIRMGYRSIHERHSWRGWGQRHLLELRQERTPRGLTRQNGRVGLAHGGNHGVSRRGTYIVWYPSALLVSICRGLSAAPRTPRRRRRGVEVIRAVRFVALIRQQGRGVIAKIRRIIPATPGVLSVSVADNEDRFTIRDRQNVSLARTISSDDSLVSIELIISVLNASAGRLHPRSLMMS